jgi:monoamine oxidase
MAANRTSVTVIGGGLAGMTAAFRLAQRGLRVQLVEAGPRLGGKAGANRNAADFDEHGYHIFPTWYLNVWSIVDELGIRDHFVECTDFRQLVAGRFPQTRSLHNIGAIGSSWRNLTSGVMSLPEMSLFYYATLDLVSQHYRERAFLDQISMSGFIRSRFYRTENVAREFQDLMLKGISVPSFMVSAMTMQKVMRNWVRYPTPMYRILDGNLQQFFIEPFAEQLRANSVKILLGRRLVQLEVDGTRVVGLTFQGAKGGSTHLEPDWVVLAIPVEKLREVLDDGLYKAAPSLFGINHLRAAAMAALDVYCNRRLVNLPRDHVNLIGSRFGLSFIDVSQTWSGYDTTVLNVIASDFEELETVSDAEAAKQIVAELQRFLPELSWERIDHYCFQSNKTEPLFMNDVGIWKYRPKATCELDNLFLAGDFCQSHIDLVSMEGAVSTGLLAAEALRGRAGVPRPVEVVVPERLPRWLFVAGRMGLMPAAAACKLLTMLLPSGVGGGPPKPSRNPVTPPAVARSRREARR